MAVTFTAAGTNANGTGTITPAFPAVVAGDLLLCHIVVNSVVETLTTPPAGFTLISGQDSPIGSIFSQWLYGKIATGAESGTVNVATSGANLRTANIYGFRGNVQTSVAAAIEDVTFAGAATTTVNMPTVDTSGTGHLAVTMVVPDTLTPASATGETGGDWVERYDVNVAGAASMQLQTADMPSAGTISGGTFSTTGVWILYGLAINSASGTYAAEVLADSPWLYWKLDDTGATAADSSGNGRTGTYNGSPTQDQAPLITVGDSCLFDASGSQYVINGAAFNSSSATVEVWFDYDGTPSGAPPTSYIMIAGCCEGTGSSTADKLIMIDDAGHAVFYVFDGVARFAVGATIMGAGVKHLVGVIDDPNNTAYIYVNGVQDGTVTAASSFAAYGNPNVMVGGASTAIGATYPDGEAGRRDEFAIYTTPLSPARIAAHYTAGLADPTTLLLPRHVGGMGGAW